MHLIRNGIRIVSGKQIPSRANSVETQFRIVLGATLAGTSCSIQWQTNSLSSSTLPFISRIEDYRSSASIVFKTFVSPFASGICDLTSPSHAIHWVNLSPLWWGCLWYSCRTTKSDSQVLRPRASLLSHTEVCRTSVIGIYVANFE